jgi:hypothetical protein
MARLDLTGQTFGRLTVINFVCIDAKGESRWNCKCECGKERVVRCSMLRRNDVYSCGCSKRPWVSTYVHVNTARRKNNKETSEYKSWQHIKERCLNVSCKAYKDYGGRGILMYPQWINSFDDFYEYVGAKPTPKHSIDRYPNNDGNYEPGNIRWATKKQQAGNRRTSRWVDYNGERIILAELIERTGLSQPTIYKRLKNNSLTFERENWKIVLDNETGVYYDNVAEAARAKNISSSCLHNWLNGVYKNKSSLIFA